MGVWASHSAFTVRFICGTVRFTESAAPISGEIGYKIPHGVTKQGCVGSLATSEDATPVGLENLLPSLT